MGRAEPCRRRPHPTAPWRRVYALLGAQCVKTLSSPAFWNGEKPITEEATSLRLSATVTSQCTAPCQITPLSPGSSRLRDKGTETPSENTGCRKSPRAGAMWQRLGTGAVDPGSPPAGEPLPPGGL